MAKHGKITLDTNDVNLLIQLTAGLDPTRYKYPETQALILRCQAAVKEKAHIYIDP